MGSNPTTSIESVTMKAGKPAVGAPIAVWASVRTQKADSPYFPVLRCYPGYQKWWAFHTKWDSTYLWGILIWLSLHTVPTPIACDIQGTNKVFPGSFTPRTVSINRFTAFHGLTFLNYPYSLHLLSIKVWLFMVWSGVRVIFIYYAQARCLTRFDFFNKLFGIKTYCFKFFNSSN